MTPAFRHVLNLLEGVDKKQMVFSYAELTNHLTTYIMQNKDKFFDERNIKVVMMDENEPLSKAFGVKAFHRIQMM